MLSFKLKEKFYYSPSYFLFYISGLQVEESVIQSLGIYCQNNLFIINF